MIAAELRSFDIPFLNGNMFRQVTISCTSDIDINYVNILYGMKFQPNITCYLIVLMDCSMYPVCSFSAHVCRCAGDKNSWMCSD